MERVKKSRTFLLIFAFLPFIFGVSSADTGIPPIPGSVPAAKAGITATPGDVPSADTGIPSMPGGVLAAGTGIPSMPDDVPATNVGIAATPGDMSAAGTGISATDMGIAAKRRDPFKSPLFVSKAASEVPASPLLKYALSEFKLVGIVWGGLGRSAVVETPDGKCYVIKKGEEIGRLRGKITEIAEEKVVVQNVVTDYLGKTQNQQIDMRLHKEEGAQ
ncbi:MAG: pilus assembly protein PilP [bacterium]